MPELPEVESVVRELRPELVGQRIVRIVTSPYPLRRPWQLDGLPMRKSLLIGDLRRRGKWILAFVNDQHLLRFHLGMSGQLVVVPSAGIGEPHVHWFAELGDGRYLRLRDPRRFGSVEWFADAAAACAAMDAVLGPEADQVTTAQLMERGQGRQRMLKALLLDQSAIAGLGNIYADESLYAAGLHPATPSDALRREHWTRLRQSIRRVLQRAIASGGSTIRDYVGGAGRPGQFQQQLAVYGRTGQPCRRCGTPIVACRLAGRTTHYCPACQRLP